MVGRAAPIATVRSGARGCRSYCPQHPGRQCAPFGWDMIAAKRCATKPEARQRLRPDAEDFGGEVSFLNGKKSAFNNFRVISFTTSFGPTAYRGPMRGLRKSRFAEPKLF